MPRQVQIKINLRGGLNPVNLFKHFDDGIRRRLPKGLAKKFREDIVSNIKTNKYGFVLSDSWTATKRRHGWDLRPFVAEGHYIDNIEIFVKDNHLSVGFKRGKIHPKASITYQALAEELEYGVLDKNIPARPLWRNTITDFFATLQPEIQQLVQEMVNEIIKI